MQCFFLVLSLFFLPLFSQALKALVWNEKETTTYKNSLRNQVPDKWYVSAPGMLRVTLKTGTHFRLAVIAFDNLGYSSVDAPHTACLGVSVLQNCSVKNNSNN